MAHARLCANGGLKYIFGCGTKASGINYVKRFSVPFCYAIGRSRVTPLKSSVMAFRSSSKRLKNVDLPTFGRPIIATVYDTRFVQLYNFNNRDNRICQHIPQFVFASYRILLRGFQKYFCRKLF